MAMIYATLIIKEKKRLSDVPNLLRPQVEEILANMGVDLGEVQ